MKTIQRTARKVLLMAFTVSIVFAVSSCLEINQHVSMTGTVMRSNTRITIQKSMFMLAEEFGSDLDMSDFPIDSIGDNVPKEYIKDLQQIDTQTEYGASITLEYFANNTAAKIQANEDSFLMPVKQGNKLILYINPTEMDQSSEYSELMTMIFSGFKYRLFVSKSVLANPRKITIARDDEYYQANLVSYPDFTMIEIPMLVIFGDEPFQIIIE